MNRQGRYPGRGRGQPDPRLPEAVRLLQSGRLAEADAICRQILVTSPNDSDVLQLSGIICLQLNRPDEAAARLGRALAVNPNVAPLHDAMAEALRRLGRLDDAVRHYRRAAELAPNVPVPHVNLGNVLARLGRYDEAARAYANALRLAPNDPAIHNNLGITFGETGRIDEAIACYNRAIALNAAYVEAYNNLGNALRRKNDPEAAIGAYRRALVAKPDHAPAYNNLGIVLLERGDLDAAGDCFRRVIALNPGYAVAHDNLGLVLRAQGRLDAAIAAHRQALALVPRHVVALNNLGVALREHGDLAGAKQAFHQALAIDPDMADAQANLGGMLRAEGALDEAIAALGAALARQPGLPLAEAELIYAQSLACDWSGIETWTERLVAAARRQPGLVSPFILLCCGADLKNQLFAARQWLGSAPRSATHRERRSRPSDGKIRLGYLSADFRDAVVGRLLPELIERHDRNAFSVAAYSYGPDDGGETRRRLHDGFDRFTEIGGLAIDAAVQQIRADNVDILIDLMGYTQGGRWSIPAARPAPIQVSFLGYPATMGADFIDYLIVDRWIAPLDEQPFYTERLVQLPDCYQPSDTRRRMGPAPSRAELGLPEHGFVFCCFNNSYKITPALFGIWSRLLRQVPDSVLWLVKSHPSVETNLRREAAARGIPPERLVFADRVAMPGYLARLRAADLFLDTLPYNAGATANDALWAGLPVLTCSGTGYTGRMAGSLLRAAGLPEPVTGSLSEYEAVAFRLATEPGLLAGLRERLAGRRDTVALFDMARYTSHLETAYRRMFEIWQRGEAPSPFAVEPLPR